MNDNQNEYEELIKIIKAVPQAAPPPDITQNIMKMLNHGEKLSTWRILYEMIAEAGRISWSRFTGINEQTRNTSLYFLIAGLFFFFIGTVLFSSVFYMGHASKATAFIFLQSILVLTSAGSLLTGGMLVASSIQGSEHWAKTSIGIYEFLMTLAAIFIAVAVKTLPGLLLAVAFTAAVIVTGMILRKALDNRQLENKGSFTGELHNA